MSQEIDVKKLSEEMYYVFFGDIKLTHANTVGLKNYNRYYNNIAFYVKEDIANRFDLVLSNKDLSYNRRLLLTIDFYNNIFEKQLSDYKWYLHTLLPNMRRDFEKRKNAIPKNIELVQPIIDKYLCADLRCLIVSFLC